MKKEKNGNRQGHSARAITCARGSKGIYRDFSCFVAKGPARGGDGSISLLYIDLFCGAGGTSTGVENAVYNGKKIAKVIACVNHDKNAIASHKANHPDAIHYMEDIRTLELGPMVKHVQRARRTYPNAKVVLWASLECTNFSKAKGGQPRDADSRTLAEHLFRYVEALKPDYIQIENVEEFMCWGDLDENGKPVSRDRGRCYLKWVNAMQGYGYDYDWRILNAADYGAYTSRRRFFGQFARKGLPTAWPAQTHARSSGGQDLFPGLYKPWNPVREVLDLEDEGTSIFDRKTPLCEKTLERIYAGLVKFVAGGRKQHEAWILKYNSMNRQHRHNAPSIDEPCPTVAVQNRLGIEKLNFLSKQFSGDPMGKNQGIDRPAGTGIDTPCFTLIARMDKMPPYLVTTEQGDLCIAVYEADSPMTRKVKEFMAVYGIIDVKMRMLNIRELKRIMGFPEGYALVGSQAEQKKYIGNAVEVNMARVLCEALCGIDKEIEP